jgi:hypothetical protein
MVDDDIRDPDRIATLLRAELEGLSDPPFDSLSIVAPAGTDDAGESAGTDDAGESAGTDDAGEPAFVALDGEDRVFEATKQDDRLVLEFKRRPDAVLDAAEAAGLPARPKATRPPGTVVFVERAAAVKRVIDVLRATHRSQ